MNRGSLCLGVGDMLVGAWRRMMEDVEKLTPALSRNLTVMSGQYLWSGSDDDDDDEGVEF